MSALDLRLAHLVLFTGAALLAGTLETRAQPEPTFRTSCSELRTALKSLAGKEGELITIEVEGPLTMVKTGAGVTYLGLCQAPDPRVLCVTYDSNGRNTGERIVVSGSWEQVGPDHVKLDPCLHFLPGEPAP
ncbi:conserved hypothetical protein [Bosea sp. 62]|uniref:hypothetical protein n=1 Tax=unclassified Bosea (in: a-proteobacteria) TaxID=2653178 RepID=UPI0012587F7F|nr:MULTISPECIES: hypothetical protein [unclassified Bosea (in: a-proteobacteria)]CAD5278639.1 conserved hypothetical protein [Bosea sp. 21B]CAD5279746.1 conserved hypothetical protein [Bosea sp. 46]VVT59629.1 conserved hypothetical protein [Bosea sp. EC-HK365B]VXB36847.1 conserved hypothetical protein [Bosea sp. 62]VXC31101.1 conserved hypothetical protein [Bosea sp. 29B]